MPAVTDLSPDTVLVAGSSGWRYTVIREDIVGNEIVARGRRGLLTVDVRFTTCVESALL